jgi:GMP synthase-like glutamine amidotransferase
MKALILKNIASEGPGTVAEYMDARGIAYRTVEPGGVARVESLDGYGALVVMGGPMGVYEADEHPSVTHGMRLIEEALARRVPTLCVCLGAQMAAAVLGARVYKGDAGTEVGWRPVWLTPEGAADPAMSAYASGAEVDAGDPVDVFHWHGDTFDLPAGAVRLASSEMYTNQAFSYGPLYALQFHVEVTPAIVGQWFEGDPARAAMLARFDRDGFARRYSAGAAQLYERLFSMKPIASNA